MRYLALLIILIPGCNILNPHKPVVVQVPPLVDYTPYMTWCVQVDSTPDSAPPLVDPQIGDSCPSCGGDGVMGDGVTKLSCRDCGGDGLIHKGDLILGSTELPETSVLAEPEYYMNYEGREYIYDGTHFVSEGVPSILAPRNLERMANVKICQGNNYCTSVPIRKR